MTTENRIIGSARIQIIVVNEARSGVSAKNGRPWQMQDAECILLNDDGTPSQVGVLQIPRDMLGKVSPGVYRASFTLRPDLRTRQIEASVVSLTPEARPAPAAAKA